VNLLYRNLFSATVNRTLLALSTSLPAHRVHRRHREAGQDRLLGIILLFL